VGPIIKGYSHGISTQKERDRKQLLAQLNKGKRQPSREKYHW
jgi:hypothetical protein